MNNEHAQLQDRQINASKFRITKNIMKSKNY